MDAAQFYLPGKGFTCLILFGGKLGAAAHPGTQVRSTITWTQDSYGYDGQYYAQMAVKPLLMSRDLAAAMDNLPYRARRILFCWTAYVLGLGRPAWVLQAYALQNILAWLLLAWLLLRWFPPTDPSNLVRWAGVMFAWGLTMSVREVVDGRTQPAADRLRAWRWPKQGRRWTSACVLGIAGLGRETNLLARLALAPRGATGAGAKCCAPPAAASWRCRRWRSGWPASGMCSASRATPGCGNFAAPFAAYFAKWYDTRAGLRAERLGLLRANGR